MIFVVGRKGESMSDLIYRHEAIKGIRSMDVCVIYDDMCSTEEAVEKAIVATKRTAMFGLECMNSAEPKKKGKWLVHGDVPKTCSCCHEDWDKYVNGDVWYTDELPKYCPNCGSYNGGEEE